MGEDGGRVAGEASDVWAAAGMEHARAAASHQCATMDACRHSWAAMVDAGGAMKAASVANGRIVGRKGGRASRDSIAETASALQRVVDALDRAAVEFSMAAKLSEMAADGWARAERALARAGNRRECTARERSDEARKMATTLRSWSERSRLSAGALRRSAGKWVAHTAEWGDGSVLDDGDRDKWMESQGAMQDVADDELATAEMMLRRTDAAARVAAGDLERIASEAGRRTGAAMAAAGGAAGSDALREAAAALKEGMAAAEQAVNADRAGAAPGGNAA